MAFAGGGIVIGGRAAVYPLLVVTCTRCGFSVFVNALVAGILPRPEIDAAAAGGE
jgi:hypothetical protein